MKTKKAEGGRLGLPLAAAFLRFPAAPPARSLPSSFLEVSALPFMVAGARVLRGDRTGAFESAAEAKTEGGGGGGTGGGLCGVHGGSRVNF